MLQAYAEADLIVSCPGNFLYSSGRVGLVLALGLGTIRYGHWLGKPVTMMPQTVGPLSHPRFYRWVGWGLQSVNPLLVRDAPSKAVLIQSGLSAETITLVPDVALTFQGGEAADGRALLQTHGVDIVDQRPLLGISLINWGAQNRQFKHQAVYETAVAATIRAFVTETGGHAVLFAQVCGPRPPDDDRQPARRVYQQLADLGLAVHFIDAVVPPAHLQAAYGQMDFFLGSRLHSVIFALLAHVPMLAIAYQPKTEGVLATLDLAEWAIPIEEADSDQLRARFWAAWQARAVIRARIETQLPTVQAQVTDAVTLIAAQYHAHQGKG